MASKNEKQANLNSFFNKLATWKLNKNFHKQKAGNNRLEFLNNGYLESVEYFRQRYIIEQRRAERKGYEFSLIILNLKSDQNIAGSDTKSWDKTEDVVFSTCKALLRETDVVVKYCPEKIAILLPDTTQSGAKAVNNRICDRLNEISDHLHQHALKQTKICLYSYPVQEKEIHSFINRNIFIKYKSTSETQKVVNHIKSYYSRKITNNSHDSNFKDQRIKYNSSNAIVLENPFCLLNEVFSPFSWNWQYYFKRVFDILLSSIALILFLPVMLVIAALIRLTSSGPVLFKQERIGYMGKKFIIYKFRTMYQEKDEQIHKKYIRDFINHDDRWQPNTINNHQIYKLTNDPRITPIGKFLRRTSLDEIGQLINVIKGDMSLVGPRPPIPYEVELYDLWHKRRFSTIKPGMTGLWQICGRNTTAFDDMVRLDITYIKNWSLILDFKILFKTVWAVLSMRGAY